MSDYDFSGLYGYKGISQQQKEYEKAQKDKQDPRLANSANWGGQLRQGVFNNNVAGNSLIPYTQQPLQGEQYQDAQGNVISKDQATQNVKNANPTNQYTAEKIDKFGKQFFNALNDFGNAAFMSSMAFNKGIDPSGASTHLREQADKHEKWAFDKQKDEQAERNIANRNERVEASKDGVAKAASENAQINANMANAANAMLARKVEYGDPNVHRNRADAARAKANEYNNQMWSNRQEAIRRRQNAQAADYRWNDLAKYNAESDYLSRGGYQWDNGVEPTPEKDDSVSTPPQYTINPPPEKDEGDDSGSGSGSYDPQDVINALLGASKNSGNHDKPIDIRNGTASKAAVAAYQKYAKTLQDAGVSIPGWNEYHDEAVQIAKQEGLDNPVHAYVPVMKKRHGNNKVIDQIFDKARSDSAGYATSHNATTVSSSSKSDTGRVVDQTGRDTKLIAEALQENPYSN